MSFMKGVRSHRPYSGLEESVLKIPLKHLIFEGQVET